MESMTSIVKEKLEFRSGGTACIGYLYRKPSESLKPCVIMGSGFGGTQDTPSMIAVATAFAEAGNHAFTFDYRHLGESKGEPRQLVSIPGQLEDFMSAVQFIKDHPEVDQARLGLWGSSLGGGHVISVAAKMKEISAVIAQIPFNGFPKKSGRSLWQTMRLLHVIRKDWKREQKGLSPLYIPAVGPKGELAVMAGDEAAKTIAGMQSKTWRNEVAPRGIVEMIKYKPSHTADQIKAAVLICYGEYDQETQGPQTAELIKSIPHAEVKAYPVTHFEFYEPGIREQIIADQIDFLRRSFT